MSTFLIMSHQITEKGAGFTSIILSMGDDSLPRKRFEADKLAQVQAEFDSFIAANAAHPLPLQWSVVCRQGRKPNGFDRATDRGGSLFRETNLEALNVKAA